MATSNVFPTFLTGRVDPSVAGSWNQFANAAERGSARGQRAIDRMNKSGGDFSRSLRTMAGGAAAFQGSLGGIASRLGAVSQLVENVGARIGGTIGFAALAAQAVQATSSFQNYQQRLRATTNSEEEFSSAQATTLRIARETRSDLNETIRAYARLKTNASELGLSQSDLAKTLTTVQKAIRLSGAGTQEAAAAIQQFSQAIGSDRLAGDEFKSLGENATKVLSAIRKGLQQLNIVPEFDGTIASFRKLSEEGKLTASIVIKALNAMSGQIDSEFARMSVTLSQAQTLLATNATAMLASFEKSTGTLNKLAAGLSFVAQNMGAVVTVGSGLVTLYGVRMVAALAAAEVGTSGLTRAQVAQNTIMRATAPALSSLNFIYREAGVRAAATTAATIGLRSAMTSLAAAGRGLLALLGGPLGAAITVATIGITYYSTRTTAAQRAADALGVSQDELAKRLVSTNGALASQNALLRDNVAITATKRLDEARSLFNENRKAFSGTLRSRAEEIEAINPRTAASLYDLADAFQKGSITIQAAYDRLKVIQSKNPGAFATILPDLLVTSKDEMTKAAAGVVGAGENLKNEVEAAKKIQSELAGVRPSGVSGAPGSRSTKTKAQLDADAKALVNTGDTLIAARARYRKATEDLEAEFVKGGKIDPAKQNDYFARKQQIEATLKSEVDGINAAKAAARQHVKDLNAEKTAVGQAATAREKIADIRARHDDSNRATDRSKDDLRSLDAIIAKYGKLNDARSKGLVLEAEAAKTAIDAAAGKPIADIIRSMEREAAIQDLILQGRVDEAELLRLKHQIIDQSSGSEAEILERMKGQEGVLLRLIAGDRQRALAQNEINQAIEVYARAAGDIQNSFRNLFRDAFSNPGNAAKNFAASIKNAFADYAADRLSISIFGDAQARARDEMTRALNVSAVNLNTAASALQAAGESIIAANDNGPNSLLSGGTGVTGVSAGLLKAATTPLVDLMAIKLTDVTREVGDLLGGASGSHAPGAQPSARLPSPTDRFNELGKEFFSKIFGKDSPLTKIGGKLGSAMEGMAYGNTASGIAKAIGLKQSALGSSIGGAIGGALAGPLGGAIGGLLGGTIGGLFKKTPYGTANITSASGAASITGNKANAKQAAGTLADTVQGGLQQIADRFGAELGAFNVSVGTYKGKYRVSPGGKKGKLSGGDVVDFGKDGAQEAIQFAIIDAINDGAVKGMRQGAINLLKSGKDLQVAMDKATRFEDVFTRLKQYTDPVGAAIDGVNKEFASLRKIFVEAGASSAEFADLQKLYDLERSSAIKDATEKTIGSLRSFLEELQYKGDLGLSLRDRQQAAIAAFNPLQANIAAGKSVDADKFQEAAQALLQIERDIYGSGSSYFDRLKQVTDLTARTVADQENVISMATKAGNPLDGAQASAPVVSAVNGQTNTLATLLAQNNGNLQAILATLKAQGLNSKQAGLQYAAGRF